MTIGGKPQIYAWSYSRYATYKQCPAQAKYKFIDKLPEAVVPAMERGTAIHKMAEDYATKKLAKLPKELARYKDQFEELRRSKPLVEQEWAFTREWTQTSWFSREAWLRVKVDAGCQDGKDFYTIDHKTGRRKEDEHAEQLGLYAMSAMILIPKIERVSTQIWYLDDDGEPFEKVYKITELPALQKEWKNKTAAMLNDNRFPPKPGNYCRWCSFSKSKGGPCKF